MFEYILVFHILNYFVLIVYLITNCAKQQANCPVRKVGESIRNNVVEVENSTKTAKAQRKNEKSDKSTRTKKAKKLKNSEETKVPSPVIELTQESDGKSSLVQGSTQLSSINVVPSVQRPSQLDAKKGSKSHLNPMNPTNGVLSKSAHPLPVNKTMSLNKVDTTPMLKKKSMKSIDSVQTAEKNKSIDK